MNKYHLKSNIRRSRKKTVFNLEKKKHGVVLCFCCQLPVVSLSAATLEHKTPTSLGGTDEMSNLAISHADCNHKRGNKI